MTNQQKMNEHLAAAEKWQAEVEKYEAAAMEEAAANIRAKRDRKQRHLPVKMGPVLLAHIKSVQEKDTMYQRAVSNRNAHQTMVTMYALAALAEGYGPEPEPEVKRASEDEIGWHRREAWAQIQRERAGEQEQQ
jgi:urease accessory protein UreF